MSKLGDRIKELRIKKKLSQKKLADLVGLSQQAINKIENGQQTYTPQITQLANALSVSTDYLLGEDFVLGEKLTREGVISYNRVLPILSQNDIIPWLDLGVLPDKVRSIEMSQMPDALLSAKIYLQDITNDAFVDDFFKIKLPYKSTFAIVDPSLAPTVYDIVLALLPDKKIKPKQFIKDGDDFFLRSLNPAITEHIAISDTRILGVISGYLHKNVDQIGG